MNAKKFMVKKRGISNMLKNLRFDFYKIFHSKVLLGLLIFMFCCTLLNPIIWYVIKDSTTATVYGDLMQPDVLLGFLWVFAVPFAAKDISSNYAKNLVPSYSEKDKIFYILSKVIYIVLFCLAFMLLNMLVEIAFNYIFGAKCIYDPADGITVGEFYLYYFCRFWNYAAMGTLFLFLSVLLKKEYIVLIIVLPYLFMLSVMLYGAVNALAGDGFSIQKYTVFGINGILYYSSLKESWFYVLTSTCYIAVFSVLSWLVFRKRSF